MSKKRTTTYHYSEAFKKKVVNEIENGKLTVYEARKLYDIKGSSTIYSWLRKLGKSHLINKVIHIQTKDEMDKIKELEKQKRELESALANAHLKIISLEATITVLSEQEGKTLKKKIVTKSSTTASKTKGSSKGNIR